MRLQVGDLVTIDRNGDSLGLIVKVNKANFESLSASQHSAGLIENSPDVYYVLLPTSEIKGPYYKSELNIWN